jgi:hypothetical protein
MEEVNQKRQNKPKATQKTKIKSKKTCLKLSCTCLQKWKDNTNPNQQDLENFAEVQTNKSNWSITYELKTHTETTKIPEKIGLIKNVYLHDVPTLVKPN